MPRIVVRPLLATLAIHALILFFMTWNWAPPERKIVVPKSIPKSINATLVDASDLRPKPKPKPKPAAKPRPKPKTVAKPKPKPKPKPAPKPTPKPEAKPKPKPKPVETTPPPLSAEELRQIALGELADSVAQEEAAAETATADEMAASYAALIRETVIGYWSRPPSARNGMEALLEVQLVPTGEVISVRVIRGSGSIAFDRSAENAVKKAGAFPELQKLPSSEFERTFRRFRLLFRPEDLRY